MKKIIGVFTALLPVALGACGATTQSATGPASTGPVAIVSAEKPGTTQSPILSPEKAVSLAALATKSEAQPKVQQKTAEPVVPLPPVGVLRGKSIAEIEAVFGKPVLLRKDKPAEVWQYLTKKCALHLIFYPEKETDGTMRVKYFSMNDRDVARKADSKICFKSQLHRVGLDRAKSLS